MTGDPRAALAEVYGLLRRHDLNDSHSGNGSVRDGDRVWITPTGCCADTVTSEDLVACEGGQPAPGASLDAPLHLAVYAARPEAGAVLHCHGPHAIAITLRPGQPVRDYVPADFEGAYYFSTVPVLDVPYADYVAQSPGAVSRALSRAPVAIVRGHGIYAWGRDLDEAYKRVASLEASARISWLSAQLGAQGQ